MKISKIPVSVFVMFVYALFFFFSCSSMPAISEPASGQGGSSALLLFRVVSEDNSITTPVTIVVKSLPDLKPVKEILIYPRTEIGMIDDLAPGMYMFAGAKARTAMKSELDIPAELGSFELKERSVVIFKNSFRFSKVVDAVLNFTIPLAETPLTATPKAMPWRLKVVKSSSEYYRSDASGGSGDTTESMAIKTLEEGEERAMLEGLRSQPAARKWKYEPIYPANAGLAREVFRGE